MLFLVRTVFATCSLRHSIIHLHAPRRVLRVSVRRICLKRRVAIGLQGGGFASAPSAFLAPCRAALVASAAGTVQPYAASVTAPALSHTASTTQTLSRRLAHPLGCRRPQGVLRCTTVSFFHAPSPLVARSLVHGPLPNRALKRTCRQRRSFQRYHSSTTVALAHTVTRQAA